MQTLGERLKMCREHRGWTLREVAERAKMSISHVSLMESGKVTPSLDALRSISDVYELTVRDMLLEVEDYDRPLEMSEPVRLLLEEPEVWREFRSVVLQTKRAMLGKVRKELCN